MNKPPKAFTLVEVLLAMAVLGVLVVVLVGILNHTARAWSAGKAQAERRQSARALIDSISNELRYALLPVDPSDPTSLQLLVNPPPAPRPPMLPAGPTMPMNCRNPDALFWQAPLATDRRLGDIAEIGYFLKWETRRDGSLQPLFCRFFVNPTDPANFLIYSKPTDWLNADILDAVAPANRAGSYRGLFAENIIGFWVRGLEERRGGLAVTQASYDSRSRKSTFRGFRIYAVFLDADGLRRLRSVPDYTTAGGDQAPDLDAFIAALPDGVRQVAHAMSVDVRLENSQ